MIRFYILFLTYLCLSGTYWNKRILNYIAVLFDLLLGGKKKSIKEYFPKIGVPEQNKGRRSVTDQFPTVMYTDPECLEIIKKKDKDSEAAYVKEFHSEINDKLKKK